MSLKKNIFSYSLINTINASVPFLLLPVLTKYLSPTDYGLLSLIQAVILFLFPLVIMKSGGLLMIEYSNSDKDKYSKIFTSALFLPLFGFLFLILVLYFTKDIISNNFAIPKYFLVYLPFLLLLHIIPTFLPILFQAMKKPKYFGYYKILMTLLNVLGSLLFIVFLSYNWIGRIYGIYISYFIFSVIGFYYLYKNKYISFNLSFKTIKEVASFGIPLIPHAIAGVVIVSSSKFFLSNMSNNFDVGVYSVALQVSGGLGILMMSINQAWAPILFERLNTDSSIKNKLQIVRLTYKIMLVMLLLSIIFMFALPFVYKFFIDVNYHGGIMISLLLVIAFLLQGFYFMVTNYILYSKKTKYLSAITVSSSLLILILNYSLIMNYKMLGAAYAMILTNLILFLSVWFFSNKIFKMPWLLNEK